jgi:aminopeptidase N
MRALLLLGLCGLLHADQYPRQPGIDVQHYVFRVTLADDTDEIHGDTTVTVRFVQDGVKQFSLDLAAGMKVSEVSAPFRRDGDRVEILLDSAPKTGELREYRVVYAGKTASGLKILTNKYGDRCFFSANWPDLAHQWLPTVDHPYDKASGEFLITAPSRYQVVANGVLVEETDLGDGRRLTHWSQREPIATWLFNIGVAQFAFRGFGTAGRVPLQTWVFRQDRDPGITTFETSARRAIEFFISHIGPYPYDKLAHVQAAGFAAGGMEHASEIFYGERAVTGQPAYGLVAHETAHQWFGDSVTEKDWDDVWLSEGFATYFAALTIEHYDGRDAFVKSLQTSRNQIFAIETKLPGVAVVQDKPWKGIPNGIVYQKGGWALHMLRGQVGTAKFWEGIREYYRRYRDANASTDDFRRVMEEVSGQELSAWFRQWLYRAGSPKLEGGWTYDGKRIAIELEQTQAGEAFRLPLEVAVGNKIEKIEMVRKRQRFEIAADQPPAEVTLDPNTWMLVDATRWESRARK